MKCKICNKRIKIKYTTPVYFNIWRQPFPAEEFCSRKCCREYLKEYGIKKKCSCGKYFYVLKKNKPITIRYCTRDCNLKFTYDKDADIYSIIK